MVDNLRPQVQHVVEMSGTTGTIHDIPLLPVPERDGAHREQRDGMGQS